MPLIRESFPEVWLWNNVQNDSERFVLNKNVLINRNTKIRFFPIICTLHNFNYVCMAWHAKSCKPIN